ncbi:MAG: methyltransferase domain-containing protein [Alphaproteobacteria bacterium]|nr:methyltransferase domain-containing protein [Alphaproteobacteria bacterium]
MSQPPIFDDVLERAATLGLAGASAEAYAVAEEALAIRPDARRALGLAARLALEAGKPQGAARHAREAARLDPGDAEAAALLGRALLAAGDDLPAAIESLQVAIRLRPDDAIARLDLGRAWLAAAEPEKALPHLNRAAALDSENSLNVAAWLTAAKAGPASELSPVFVRSLFDQYADKFDAELSTVLGYRAPEILADLVTRATRAPTGELDVLDLGCGTGLSGAAFRPFARSMVGIDLSPRMADKARARGIYDRVEIGEMTAAMSAACSWDLIIAVDALVYVGDLAPVFKAARHALRSDGILAATVEKNPDERAYALSPARRFRHGANYLRRQAAEVGFSCLAIEETILRQDRRAAVPGLAFVLTPTGR